MSEGGARLHIKARGLVQGVGMRPFAHRLAADLGLAGFVRNTACGVEIEVEGAPDRLVAFLDRLQREPPPRAALSSVEHVFAAPRGLAGFEIRATAPGERGGMVVPPDLATCADCLGEILDPRDRRHRYPFTSCSHCGPRYSIVEAMPFDRAATALRAFPPCAACLAEYADPQGRRFHAQTIACPECGPRLALRDGAGRLMAGGDQALRGAAAALRDGRIVALKGLGGYQLLCDATDSRVVARLRERKRRPDKPFAVMAASLAQARELCAPDAEEARMLASPAAPIVLVPRIGGALCEGVAPHNPLLGLMLPCTPLHHLLARDAGRALVATSGNLADEPMATDEDEARERLAPLADLFLDHDRAIVNRVDDSVLRVIAGRATLLRRARGYAPATLAVPEAPGAVIAFGAHEKSCVALTAPGGIVVGPHVGNLDTALARSALEVSARTLAGLHGLRPQRAACDLHPDYASTRMAQSLGLPLVRVQHHLAHVLACAADNGASGRLLGVAFDGAGLGTDGTLWGGEFLVVDGRDWRRIAHLRTFALPGGAQAFREPRRAALGLAFEVWGANLPGEFERQFTRSERNALVAAMERGINCPRTSSVGRLFDAVSAFAGLAERTSFEGQAAMALEFAAARADPRVDPYPLPLRGDVLDWQPLLLGLLADKAAGAPVEVIARRFHSALAQAIVAVARAAGLARVALSGGCFQNDVLTRGVVAALEAAGFEALRHRQVPPNDGGIALGQVVAADL